MSVRHAHLTASLAKAMIIAPIAGPATLLIRRMIHPIASNVLCHVSHAKTSLSVSHAQAPTTYKCHSLTKLSLKLSNRTV